MTPELLKDLLAQLDKEELELKEVGAQFLFSRAAFAMRKERYDILKRYVDNAK